LASFGGTRTFHRLTCAIEDAGWEIRDSIGFLGVLGWVFGSGFPKSLNIAEGRGTALKPAWEPIVLARKPFVGTVTRNLKHYGTSALNIDDCRIAGVDGDGHWSSDDGSDASSRPGYDGGFTKGGTQGHGRWPANVVLDEWSAEALDLQVGTLTSGLMRAGTQRSQGGGYHGNFPSEATAHDTPGDSGGPSRFFYCAKASRDEREAGCEHLPVHTGAEAVGRGEGTPGTRSPRAGGGRSATTVHNHHPTVKPIDLMRWLVRLVTPSGGTVLDPFAGSGTTGCAAALENRRFVGSDLSCEYVQIARARIDFWSRQGLLAL
jgi:site-specific DNA-methyltransferase (adenine-specific)